VQFAPHPKKALDLELGCARQERLARLHLEPVSAGVLDHAIASAKVLGQVDADPALLEGDPQAPSPLKLF
jgi:hypothetical protein